MVSKRVAYPQNDAVRIVLVCEKASRQLLRRAAARPAALVVLSGRPKELHGRPLTREDFSETVERVSPEERDLRRFRSSLHALQRHVLKAFTHALHVVVLRVVRDDAAAKILDVLTDRRVVEEALSVSLQLCQLVPQRLKVFSKSFRRVRVA